MGNQQENPIRRWAREINTILQTYRGLSSSVASHGGIIGESREFFIKEILKRFLPRTIEIGTGQIIDVNGTASNQIDIVIAKPEFPVLTSMATADIYFVESVWATIEVKSHLGGGKTGSLWKALDNCRSVRKLDIEYLGKGGSEEPFRELAKRLPATYIFGLTGYKSNLTALRKAIFHWIKERDAKLIELPNLIVTEGCVVLTNFGRSEIFNHNLVQRKLDGNCIFLAREDNEALTWLLIHLLGKLGERNAFVTGTGYGHIHYISGVDISNKTFFSQGWNAWGTWSYDDSAKVPILNTDIKLDNFFEP